MTSILEEMDIEVLGAARTPEEALDLVEEHRPSLFIFDPQVTDDAGSWLRTAVWITENAPETHVVGLSSSLNDQAVSEAIACGVTVYGSKILDPDDIKAAIRQAFRCTIFHARNVLATQPAADRVQFGGISLTRREVEVLRHVAKGMTNGQIAQALWVTEETVKFHLSNIYRKIGVNNRTRASHWAAEHGFLAGDDVSPARPYLVPAGDDDVQAHMVQSGQSGPTSASA
jgi:DNA-binding NarL/FixJ family response regulator